MNRLYAYVDLGTVALDLVHFEQLNAEDILKMDIRIVIYHLCSFLHRDIDLDIKERQVLWETDMTTNGNGKRDIDSVGICLRHICSDFCNDKLDCVERIVWKNQRN